MLSMDFAGDAGGW
jgi:hypothetical protein